MTLSSIGTNFIALCHRPKPKTKQDNDNYEKYAIMNGKWTGKAWEAKCKSHERNRNVSSQNGTIWNTFLREHRVDRDITGDCLCPGLYYMPRYLQTTMNCFVMTSQNNTCILWCTLYFSSSSMWQTKRYGKLHYCIHIKEQCTLLILQATMHIFLNKLLDKSPDSLLSSYIPASTTFLSFFFP